MSDPLNLTDDQIAALPFEEAQARLEQIVAELEEGRTPLEQAMAKYQLGLKLRDHCRGKLGAAESVLEQLREGPDGRIVIDREDEEPA